MQPSAATTATALPPSFASLLAQLTAPEKNSASAWSEDDLEDDFATLSYERALRTHGRYRASDLADGLPGEPAAVEAALLRDSARIGAHSAGFPLAEKAAALEAALRARPLQQSDESAAESLPPQAVTPARSATSYERNLKQASITIRVSKLEAEQLHQRAREAGVTVSAYLRSCTFEAEALRAEVKETLAKLRTAAPSAVPVEKRPSEARPARRSWLDACKIWWKRLVPGRMPSPNAARA